MKTKFIYFYKKLKKRQFSFKYICLTYNRHENGNAEIFLHFFNLNLIIYIKGLKKYNKKYISFIKY